MSTNTTNYALIKPGVNDPTDEDLWGGMLNENFDSLDNLLKTATNSVKREISATDTVLITDSNKMLLCDATGGAITMNLLPAATAGDGFTVIIVKEDDSANTITIDGDGTETISGLPTLDLESEGSAVIISSDGANWYVTGSYLVSQTQPTPINVQNFEASGTYTPTAGVKYIKATCTGGGAGGGGTSGVGTSGGDTALGVLASSDGGVGGITGGNGGAGGTASGGDINIDGGGGSAAVWGQANSAETGGQGGSSYWGGGAYSVTSGSGTVAGQSGTVYGTGGGGGTNGQSLTGSGGGAGATVIKIIDATLLGATETVTIGTGGAGAASGGTGKSGIVVIEEYFQ